MVETEDSEMEREVTLSIVEFVFIISGFHKSQVIMVHRCITANNIQAIEIIEPVYFTISK